MRAGETHFPGLGSSKPYGAFLRNARNYARGRHIPKNHIPADTWFLMDESGQKILGAVNIRCGLNEELLVRGGHIGYSVAPSERRKGYATEQLRLALEKCRAMGLGLVLITCDKGNIGSARVIQKNGGVLEDERILDGIVFQRYWVEPR